MARTAVALIVGLAAAFAPLAGLQAQTSNSIEDAPGYRTVPEAEPAEATIGSPGVFGTTDTDPEAPDPYSSGVLPSEPALEQLTPADKAKGGIAPPAPVHRTEGIAMGHLRLAKREH